MPMKPSVVTPSGLRGLLTLKGKAWGIAEVRYIFLRRCCHGRFKIQQGKDQRKAAGRKPDPYAYLRATPCESYKLHGDLVRTRQARKPRSAWCHAITMKRRARHPSKLDGTGSGSPALILFIRPATAVRRPLNAVAINFVSPGQDTRFRHTLKWFMGMHIATKLLG